MSVPVPPSSTVLLDDEHVQIVHRQRGGDGTALVVTFDPLLYLWNKPPFGSEFLHKMGVDVVAVRKKAENFYQPLTRDAFEAAVTPVAQRYARVIAYGSSLGAYAALYFSRDQPWTVIASSPRVSVHPEFGDPSWQQRGTWQHERFRADRRARCHAVILYDPYDRIDRNYLRGEVLQQFPHAEVMRIPFAGHPVNNFLGDIGFIAPYVRAVVAGEPPPQLQRRAHRMRSANYHQVLALLCVQRGHVGWAEPLAQRAVTLAPTRMLMQRTMGLVQLEQGRWSEAQATLEKALALSPDDPYTISLLARAQAGPQARQDDTRKGLLRRAGQRLRRLIVRR